MTNPFIILGAHGGIGEALALGLAKAGYQVIATMRDPQSASPALKDSGADIHALDVTHPQDFETLFADQTQIAGLAYCIGSIDLLPLKATKDEHFLSAFEVNLLGAARALRGAERALKAGAGSVVLFSSIAVTQGFNNHTVISAAKGAVEGFTKALAAEWAGQVRVNAIAPSLTDTPLASKLTASAPMKEAIEKLHPIPRLGRAEEIAALAQFLLTDQAGWITGQILHVDGGRSTLKPKG